MLLLASQQVILRFVFRGFLKRWIATSLAVLALAVALATLLACWRMSSALDTGKPKGTHFEGEPVSLFQYSDDSRLHFFLSPNQIKNLSIELEGSADLVAASGVRALTWTSGAAELPIHVDFVSDNFFAKLGVQFSEGKAAQFSATEDGVVLSAQFLQVNGLSAAPDTIRVGGRVLRVVGVVSEFSGLFDRDSQAWINWHQSSGLLYPPPRSGAAKGLDDGLWFFWTLAIPKAGEQNRFHTLLDGLVQRAEGVEPPFSALVALPGITNQTDLRADADKSQTLYWTMSWLLLIIAALAIGLLIALIRLSRLSSEWTMLRLGAGRTPFFMLGLAYAALPVLLSGALAILLAGIFQRLLLMDPSVAALMAWSAELEPDPLWLQLAVILFGILSICTTFNMLVMRGAGARFGAVVLRTQTGHLDKLFLVFSALIAAAASLTLLIGVLAAQESWAKEREMASAAAENVWFQALSAKEAGASISREQRLQLQAALRINPNIRKTGFAALLPLSGAKIALSEYSVGANTFKLMVNMASSEAIPALNLPLRAGRIYVEGSESEIVLDEDAARLIQAKISPLPVLGAVLRDELGAMVVVVGIVGRVSYTSDLSQAPPVAYLAMPDDQVQLSLVMQGQLKPSDLQQLQEIQRTSAANIKFAEIQSFPLVAERLRERFQARSTLTIATSLCALVVAVFLLSCAGVLRARRRERDYAIRMSLGAQPGKIISHFLKAELTSNFIGALLGICIVIAFNVPARLFLNILTVEQVKVGSMVLLGFCTITVLVLFLAIRPSLTRVALTAKINGGDI